MYNFTGLFYRMWAVSGVILLVGIICVLIEKPWAKGFIIKNCIGIIAIALSVILFTGYSYAIKAKDISSYTGEFISTNRNSRVAPPLPFTDQYVFWNGEGKKKVVYLDVFSKKKIYSHDFKVGQNYTVYYDEHFNIIVKIEKVCE